MPMGETIEFGRIVAYLADGGGPGIVVIHEWWGLVPHIRDICDRFANLGFTGLPRDAACVLQRHPARGLRRRCSRAFVGSHRRISPRPSHVVARPVELAWHHLGDRAGSPFFARKRTPYSLVSTWTST